MEGVATAAPETAAPAAAEKPAPVPKDERNGVTRPKAGTDTRRVWDKADELTAVKGSTASKEEVADALASLGMNKATVATQYSRWRKYHGLTGITVRGPRASTPKTPEQKAGDAVAAAAAPGPADQTATRVEGTGGDSSAALAAGESETTEVASIED